MASTPPLPTTKEFLDGAERELLAESIDSARADWVYATYIGEDTGHLRARANARLLDRTVALAKRSLQFHAPEGTDEARKLWLLRLTQSFIAPSGPTQAEELAQTVAAMEGAYAQARVQLAGQAEPLALERLDQILNVSREPQLLLAAWRGWHDTARTMRPLFQRYVRLSNAGAKELGFQDAGAMWRSRYDTAPEALAAEVERVWREIRPLYVSLHAYVRTRLREHYGPTVVPEDGPIPAHLLGNMWAQSWEHIFPLLAPPGSEPAYDLTELLRRRQVDATEMVRFAERFFVSLGLDPLPPTFWQRSLLVRPRDRDVVCHASAWDIDYDEDLRIKMCIEVTAEDFGVIHHELGHNYYQRAYRAQPFLFRDSANDGFHEALGDTIGLSVTPEYLVRVGLLSAAPGPEQDIGRLLHTALQKIAFLPFGYLIDQWRWKVFSGEIPAEEYTRSWWALRREYQGIAPAVDRTDADFDPGAKYHVPASVPYLRYFLAHILQFQFHRALARVVGWTGPLHRCSIYGSREAGQRLRQMMELGQSRPWPEALYAVSAERRLEPGAVREYFAPLQRWLDEQNASAAVGW